jgi:tetratricopeptide (TPR) repeat protein
MNRKTELSGRTRPGVTFLAAFLIAAAALAAYANSFRGPFVFDDQPAIRDNPAIRQLTAVWGDASGRGLPTSGRPMVGLSLALNYAAGGLEVGGYHAVNLAIHILAGLTLFGIVRRTLRSRHQSRAGAAAAGSALPPDVVAFAAALLWTLHPLQTESVTYIVQRAESMMGLFYLLTLYAFIRSAEPAPGAAPAAAVTRAKLGGWGWLSILACFLGMACKEVMVSAPLMVWLYDRTFVSGSFGAAWRRHGRLYRGLAATWVLLIVLAAGSGGRDRTAGFHAGVEWWRYACAQFPALVRYLRLALWPQSLVFDYGRRLDTPFGPTLAAALAIAVLLAGTIWALRQRPVLGFLGAWFFLILAPTSSVVPLATEVVAEHRLYLPLAAVVVAAVLALRRAPLGLFLALTLGLAAVLGGATAQRNRAYQTELALWEDTARHRPGNPDAQYNLGLTLAQAGRIPEAEARYAAAVALDPDFAQAQTNLAFTLDQLGQTDEALAHFQVAVGLRPDLVEAQNDLGNLLLRLGRGGEAIAHYRTALHWQPGYPLTHLNLGIALARDGRLPEAAREFQSALQLQPDFPEAYFNLGNLLGEAGNNAEAIRCYEAALRYRPAYPAARSNLDVVRARLQHAESNR